jgi:pentatricopeptide repeat protein
VKTKEFTKLATGLLPDFPGFAVQGAMLVMCPMTDILRAIHFETSGFDKTAFYVHKFVLPLFVPTEHIYFNFGDRLRVPGGGKIWNVDDIANLSEVIRREALPFLRRAATPLQFVKLARSRSMENPHTWRAVAFGLARAGRFKQAIRVIDRMLPPIDVDIAWQRELVAMTTAFRATLAEHPSDAERQLEVWKQESLRKFKLEEFI